MGTQVQASTTKSRRLQPQRNTTRKLSHAVMFPPPRCLLASAEREGGRSFRRLYSRLPNTPTDPSHYPCRWLRQRSPRSAGRCEPEGTAGPRLPAAEGRATASRCGAALRRAGPWRRVIASIAPSRAPGAPPPPANGSRALPHRRERPAGRGRGRGCSALYGRVRGARRGARAAVGRCR